ncbi:dihydrofolate reductase family protein [Streptomyces sp. Da 82-17]|uniref:dihydrofolate reductase family protein n=1 Tax=Streptomyces sp. Da 82-17 TaxID=3377116 RepID=UPI0038D3D969
MSTVYTHMTMSLDGYIADPDDGIDELFGWYQAGDVAVPTADEGLTLRVDPDSAEVLRGFVSGTGALVCGRRLFDITDGWNDNHPVGAPVVVVTHRPPEDTKKWPRTTFAGSVEEGVARAKEIAGGKDVSIASADIARQAVDLGLVDEVQVSLVPVLLGRGIPYFAELTGAPHHFDDPVVVQGKGATHLRFRVRRAE